MTKRLLSALAAAALSFASLSFASLAALAQDATVGALTIEQPWSRATPPAGKTGAGYLTIENKGATDDRLTGAAIDPAIADAAELHTMSMDNGIMRMRPVDGGLAVPAGQTVALSPGGVHIMLVGLKAPLKQGTRVPLTLTFEKAGTVRVELDVGKAGAAGPAGH
jgi:copper(I)-binding protein